MTKRSAPWTTSKKMQEVIANLHLHGNLEKACRAANVSRISVWQRRQTDQDFADAYEAARKCGLEVLKDEAHRRAYEGILKPVYHKGEHCGLVREYSDSLLMFLIKQADPSYREAYQVELGNAGSRPFMLQMALHPEAIKQQRKS